MRILIADDHKIFRDGLRHLLDGCPGFRVVAEAEDGAAAVRLAREHAPDLVVMDISMPCMNGIDATARIVEEIPSVRVIVLSMHDDRRFVVEALKAGALGYLLKESAFEDLLLAIEAARESRVFLSPRLAESALRDYIRIAGSGEESAFAVLSGREREVLQLIAEGSATKEIAARLHVSVKTIETHRGRIMEKLHLRSVAELTKYAIREGLTTLE
ncbi:MAG: response regulator transcription factor [Candidatus Eisenbacteria bacterium]|nr:response regulator transcription factor [Candidatus Eisenbacteria bacterium]